MGGFYGPGLEAIHITSIHILLARSQSHVHTPTFLAKVPTDTGIKHLTCVMMSPDDFSAQLSNCPS